MYFIYKAERHEKVSLLRLRGLKGIEGSPILEPLNSTPLVSHGAGFRNVQLTLQSYPIMDTELRRDSGGMHSAKQCEGE